MCVCECVFVCVSECVHVLFSHLSAQQQCRVHVEHQFNFNILCCSNMSATKVDATFLSDFLMFIFYSYIHCCPFMPLLFLISNDQFKSFLLYLHWIVLGLFFPLFITCFYLFIYILMFWFCSPVHSVFQQMVVAALGINSLTELRADYAAVLKPEDETREQKSVH